MSKFKLANGWTKERALAVIKTGNNGEKAAVRPGSGICSYKTADGNKCFVGCFIPDGHPAQFLEDSVYGIANRFPETQFMLPLDLAGSSVLQRAHDRANFADPSFADTMHPDFYAEFPELLKATNEHEVAQIFFDNYVEDFVAEQGDV